jgi:four helix bundle protein
MQSFHNLFVWQKSHEIVLEVYRISRTFPREELFGLTSQMRRCALSIPSNNAEGCGRGSDQDFARFLIISMGSATELEYQLFLSRELEYINAQSHQALDEKVREIKKMLTSLIQRLKKADN